VTETTERRGAARSPAPGTPSADATEIAHPAVLVVVAICCVAAVVARFAVRSPLWLDEALSVNISKLPLGKISGALRHDGHPPLYYFLLHGWMSIFGHGDRAVRALSGVISLAALPLAYRAGRRIAGPRLGWMTVIVLSLSPFFLRYGSETRMYSLLIVLVLAGYLIVENALESSGWGWFVGVTVVTALLLWTHYWSMWLLLPVGLLLVVRVIRRWRHDHTIDRAAVAVLVAMFVGALFFLPWIPTMLYQAKHTGTPWAKPFRPSGMIVLALTDFSGGPYSEPQVLMLLTVVLLAIGIFGRGIDDWDIELDLRTRREARVPAAVLGSTLAIASVIGLTTHSTFASRYGSVFFPFFIMLVALGLDHVKGRVTRNVTLLVFVLLSMVGLGVVFTYSRSQAGVIADAIAAQHQPNAIVVTCPDQLGPSVSRAVDGRWPVVTYPRFAAPERVDWVDYGERNRHNDPKAFAAALLERAGDRPIYTVMNNTYRTLGNQCAEVVGALTAARPTHLVVAGDTNQFYESMSMYVTEPPTQ
jgi:mannosyltransferase